MTVKRFIGIALFTWLMCWTMATGFSDSPTESPVVQTSPRITVQMFTPSEIVGQLYPPTTTTIPLSEYDTYPYYEEDIIAEELRDLPCAQWFSTALNAGWPNDTETLKTLSKIM